MISHASGQSSSALVVSVLGRFQYGEQEYEFAQPHVGVLRGKLPSLALAAWMADAGRPVRLLFLAPESLVVSLEGVSAEEAFALLEDQGALRRRMLAELQQHLLCAVSGIPVGLEVVPSIGRYRSPDGAVRAEFKAHQDDVVVWSLAAILACPAVGDLYLDLSVGQNLYTVSALEALRAVVVGEKLRTMLTRPGGRKAWAMASSPLSSGWPGPSPVAVYEFDVKAFFDLPLARLPKPHEFIGLEPRALERELTGFADGWGLMQKSFHCLRRAFNAIKHSAPLTLFYDSLFQNRQGEGGLAELWESNAAGRLESFLTDLPRRLDALRGFRSLNLRGSALSVNRGWVNRPHYVGLLLSLSLLRGVLDFWAAFCRGKVATLSLVREAFPRAFGRAKLGVTSTFLEAECEWVKGVAERAEANGWDGRRCTLKRLEELAGGGDGPRAVERELEKAKSVTLSSPKRNFFAHAGMLKDIVLVERKGEDLALSYDEASPTFQRELGRWLDKPGGL